MLTTVISLKSELTCIAIFGEGLDFLEQCFFRKTKKSEDMPIHLKKSYYLTLIVKFLGYELDRLLGKLIHQIN